MVFQGINYSCNISIFQKEKLHCYLDQMLNACRKKASCEIKNQRFDSICMILPNPNMAYHCMYLLNCKFLNCSNPERVYCLILLSYQKIHKKYSESIFMEKIACVLKKFEMDRIHINDDPLKFHSSEIIYKYDENADHNKFTTSIGSVKRKKDSSANILKFYNPKYNQPLFSIEIIEPQKQRKSVPHPHEVSVYRDLTQNSSFRLLFGINICGFFEQKRRNYCIKIDNADNFRIFYRNFNKHFKYSSYDSKSQKFLNCNESCQIAVEKIMVALTKTFIDLVSRSTMIYTFHDAFDFYNIISVENVMYTRFLLYKSKTASCSKNALGKSLFDGNNESEDNQELYTNLNMTQILDLIGQNGVKQQICETISYDFLNITRSQILQHNVILQEWKIIEILRHLCNVMSIISVDFDSLIFSSYCKSFFANYSAQKFKKLIFEIEKCTNQTLKQYQINYGLPSYSKQNQNSDENLDGPPEKKPKKCMNRN